MLVISCGATVQAMMQHLAGGFGDLLGRKLKYYPVAHA